MIQIHNFRSILSSKDNFNTVMAGNKDSKKTESAGDQSSKLDAIKDIIFGQQIQEYEKEFEEIRQTIEANSEASDASRTAMQEQLTKQLETIQEQLSRQIEASQEKLLKEIAKLSDQKTDRKALGKMLENIGNKLSS